MNDNCLYFFYKPLSSKIKKHNKCQVEEKNRLACLELLRAVNDILSHGFVQTNEKWPT